MRHTRESFTLTWLPVLIAIIATRAAILFRVAVNNDQDAQNYGQAAGTGFMGHAPKNFAATFSDLEMAALGARPEERRGAGGERPRLRA